ncbi:acyl-CoA dehydrogenase [Humitalea rosea]|uniref:Acyl-CoA dehydrogenase n=1 Tax=Humitalea rosea TaxID=990373 RepID=A0A2W7JZA9_9PROT|nr:acyl-CoA dehydrogenase family protein [Humitalea rosea]PZW40830.1 acyl-CoA dehydrogenase [Humitalea rosea]
MELTEDLLAIREGIAALCADFPDEWWQAQDSAHKFPHLFYDAIAKAGFLGICVPEEFGGSGLGITEAAVMMEAISGSGAGLSGASAIHMNIFGLNPVIVFGNQAQKERALPPLVAGREKACFGVTEPGSGLDTTRLTTRAERVEGGWSVTGQKIWISTAQVADRILLLARTAPRDEGKPTHGLSLFYTALDRSRCSVREIEKMGRAAVDSNEIFFDGYAIPAEDLVGAEGQGFRQILHGLNPERILIAAEAVGLGRAALRRATAYAKERVVFGRPIGMNQSIQHPLAEDWMALEAAWLMVLHAARLYDAGRPCGVEANAAKYLAAEAATKTCRDAIATHGGMGYAREYHVERYLREAMIPWLAPVSPNLILCHVAEKALGLPRSY